MNNLTVFDTCLGWMGIMVSPKGLRKVILPQKSRDFVIDRIKCECDLIEDCDFTVFGDLPERLRCYLIGKIVDFSDKVDLEGATLFQQRVWWEIRSISYGETRSYAWVAEQLGCAKAARAVGQALGKNPVPIIIPCHRVISSDSSLGGYKGDIELKRQLLSLEIT